MSVRTETLAQRLRRKLLALALSLAAVLPNVASAATDFSSLLDLELSVVGGAIENKFGFATSFPRPDEAPGFGDLNGNPGGAQTLIALGGGTANLFPINGKDGIERKTVAGGRGMKLNASGNTNAAIAAELHISQATVKTHLLHIYDKLGVSDRAAAVAVGYENAVLS